MSSAGKQLSNPYSTGGGGVNFETRVQALFAVLRLTGGFAPCLPSWPIKKIKLQGKYAGYETDDFIVFVEDSNTETVVGSGITIITIFRFPSFFLVFFLLAHIAEQ